MEMECSSDNDDGMQDWGMEMECTGDYDDGMQEWGMEMECTGDYDDGMQEGEGSRGYGWGERDQVSNLV